MSPAAPSTQSKSQEHPAKETTDAPVEPVIDPDNKAFDEIRESVSFIEKGISTKEEHYIGRAIRAILPIRRSLNPNVLRILVGHYFPKECEAKVYFMQFLPDFIETNGQPITPTKSKIHHPLSIETEVYLHLLLLVYLLDKQRNEEAVKCSNILMDRLSIQQSRFLAIIAAKCYYYFSRAYELVGRLDEIRNKLHKCLRTAILHNHYEAQSTLINLLLYNYLKYHLYDQMHKLINKITFPPSSPNSKWARFLYYQGRVKAVQLEYNQAHGHLVAAMRKAPQQTAVGFKQNLYKFTIVVELLMGEIPDRAIFRDPIYEQALLPYFELTKAIQTGDLAKFIQVKEKYTKEFIGDETNSLIIRLKHNVIKAGVRKISLSYSRISLDDVAKKLNIEATGDIDYIVAKAIHDGVIDAKIDHEKRVMITNETLDLYTTKEPMNQFNDRINFCLGIRNQAVKAMRYPPKQYNKELETAEERREREQQELETAKELTEDDFDGYP